jgi:hypothetical protein
LNYASLVDVLMRAFMKSRTADSGYRTARPIFTKRGPVPLSLDLASQDVETLNISAVLLGCRRGSKELALGLLGFSMASPSLTTMDDHSPK